MTKRTTEGERDQSSVWGMPRAWRSSIPAQIHKALPGGRDGDGGVK